FQNEKMTSSYSSSIASSGLGMGEKPLYENPVEQLLHADPDKNQENKKPHIGIEQNNTKPSHHSLSEDKVLAYVDCDTGVGGVSLDQDVFNDFVTAVDS